MKRTFTFFRSLLLPLFFSPYLFGQTEYRVFVSEIDLPINNYGILAQIYIDGNSGGRIDDMEFLFAGGFYLSGKHDDSIWTNVISWGSDYQPGPEGSLPYDPRNIIYVVKNTDPHFGESWQRWRFAVENGAAFYDGNGDGIYNPVDLNGNGVWDPNEDRPDLIGDITAWCVYNDGKPDSLKTFKTQQMGIEIHQSVFAFTGQQLYEPLKNVIFIRYKIFNTGFKAESFDSVFFGSWNDTDLGEYHDDLSGSDSSLNSGYVYNDGEDAVFGINPPAHFVKIVQGPFAYIPGETFIDNNNNGIYDPGIDTPLTSAFNRKGKFLGSDIFEGAKNQPMTAYIHYMRTHPDHGDPYNQWEARNYLMGLHRSGTYYDPCTYPYGNVIGGINCNEVNPLFLFSGDPVNQTGWINNFPNDQRQLISTGPFRLEVDKPVTIIKAYIAARGADALNSIEVSREIADYVSYFYISNFGEFPVSVDNRDFLVLDFKLFQNYPNPFNPSTKISWHSPVGSWQTIKVFDVLGREVATLVDEFRNAGSYEVEFDAAGLASGIYYYQLKSSDFIETKKMILIR